MDNTNSFDWVAVQLQGSDKTFDDLSALGVDPNNTTLQDKDFYRKAPKVEKMFTDKEGKFDQKGFDSFYLNAEKSLNQYKKANTSLDNVTMDLWDDNSITRALAMPIRRTPVKVSLTSKDPFTNLKVAQESFLGLTEINKWSTPKKSIAEVAQGQKVLDGKTGKELDYTADETGLFNLYGFLSEPLVLATYDEDQKDENGKVINKKGDYKFDENGIPRYETLSGRDPSGKQVLSRLDTLTKEGSYFNKFDFMDSDDMNKSITGSIVKAAVQYAPMLIGGPLGTAYTAYYIASGFLDAGAELSKSIDSMMNGASAKEGNRYKWANQLQGHVRQFKSGVSEEAKANFWDLENILTMAVDSVYQLKSQKALVEWPMEIKKYQLAKELGVKGKSVLNVGDEAASALQDITKYSEKYGLNFVNSAKKMAENASTLEKYAKYASYMSTSYMAATSALGISEVAEMQGLDAKDKAFLYVGYMAGAVPLYRSNIGRWVEGRIDIDDLSKNINVATKEYASKYLPTIIKEVEGKVGKETARAKALTMIAAGKDLGSRVMNYVNLADANKIGVAMAGEALEEMTEQAMQNTLQGIYNGLASAGIKSTQEDVSFDMDPMSIARDIALAGFGGAFGGAIFHLADRNHSKAFKSDNLLEYVTEGHTSKVIDVITDLKNKGQLGDTSMSVSPLIDEDGNTIEGMWKPVTPSNNQSQNDFIADRLLKTVKAIEALKISHNIANPQLTAETKNEFFQNLVDTKTDTDLRDRIHDVAQRIYNLSSEIQSIDGLDKETEEGLLNKKAELKVLQKELEYLQGDESVDEFFRQGLFNTRTDISSKFGVKNKESLAKEMTNKSYKELTKSQKEKVDSKYNEYILDESEAGIRADLKRARDSYEKFNEVMHKKGHYDELENYKQSLESLKKYVDVQIRQHKPEGEDVPIGEYLTYNLTKDYFTQLNSVKYVPDYIYDLIKNDIGKAASTESDHILSALSNNLENLKTKLNTSLKDGLANDKVREYIGKLIGDKKLTEILESEEYRDIFDNKVPKSNFSTLKLIKTLSTLHTEIDTSKLKEQLDIADRLSSLDFNEVDQAVMQYAKDEIDSSHPILQEFSQVEGLLEYVDELKEQGLLDDTWGDMFFEEGLNKFIQVKQMTKKLGEELSAQQLQGYIESFNEQYSSKNVFIGLIANGKFSLDNQDILGDVISTIDTQPLEESIKLVHDFDKERVASPLRNVQVTHGKNTGILKDTYDFLDSEEQNLKTVGVGNYLNVSDEFSDALDSHIAAAERVGALIEAAATVNPLVNDFRKNNKSILQDPIKDELLFQIEDDDKAALAYELKRLNIKLKFLKDVNDFNKNNVLTKLLKEDGYELISKVKSLRDLTENEAVAELIPSLRDIHTNVAINDYYASYENASEEVKYNAMYNMTMLEEAIYKDVQKLPKADKISLVNMTFTLVNPDSSAFYDTIDAKNPLNDYHRTIYLATIFGSSSLAFYNKYAGEYSDESNTFSNLERSKFIPFAKQESAVRVADLVINGDKDIVEYLYNAYTYANSSGDSINFAKPAYDNMITNYNTVTVFGSPGTGKTTAVVSNIMNLVPNEESNTLLLAPKERQANSLKDSLINSGFEHRINKKSNTIKGFLASLGIKQKDGTLLDFNKTEDYMQYEESGRTTEAIRIEFYDHLNTPKASQENSGLLEKLDIVKAGGDLHNHLMNELSNYKMIILDEFTHVNPVDIAILTRLLNIYNASDLVIKDPTKKITLVNLGDENQLSYVNKDGLRRDYTSVVNTVTTQPLLNSLRSGWDLINNTLTDITRRTIAIKNISAQGGEEALRSTEVLQSTKNNPIQLFNYESTENGNIGIKYTSKSGETTVEDLQFITANKDRLKGKQLVYVVNDETAIPKAQAVLKEAFGSNWTELADVEIYTPDEVQGGEYEYAIIDASPKLTGGSHDIVRTFEFLNTMFSRAKTATLFLDNGSTKDFISLENASKPKAIKQIKITDEIIQKVKDNKQRLLESILRDYVPEEVKSKVTKSPRTVEIPVAPMSRLTPIFTETKIEAMDTSASASNITAYTTFSTKEDFHTLFKVMYPEKNTAELEESKAEIEKTLNSYKYYLLKRGELGDNNITLAGNFKSYFSDYNYEKPKFYIEVTKREGKDVLDGRSELNPKKNPEKTIMLLKVKLESKVGQSPMVLTMGALNDLVELKKKYLGKKNLEQSDRKVNTFLDQLTDFMTGKLEKLPIGESVNGVWKSKEFSQREFDQMSTIFSARLLYDNNRPFSYNEFKKLYPDFLITDPQVVVATISDDEDNLILHNEGKNPEYKKIWKELQGTSVAFISEYMELSPLSKDQLLDIYIKQMELFNNPVFKKADNDAKKRMIDEVEDVIRVSPTMTLRYKPNMVQMIRLTNPTSTFLNFRQRYLASIAEFNKEKGSGKNIQQMFEKFDMTPYVKDRLLKSLITIRTFLNDKNNQDWFEQNVLIRQNKDADKRINKIRQDSLEQYGEVIDFDSNFNEVALDAVGELKLTEFVNALDDLIYGKELPIVSRKFETKPNSNARVTRLKSDTNVTEEDLKLNLTNDKRIDFSNSIIDLNLLNLFKKTKNLNFAELIDLSLQAFADFPKEKRFDKYRLDEVFKGGEIENITIAAKSTKESSFNNVLANVHHYGNTFTFGFKGLQQPAYNIAFDKLIDSMMGKATAVTEEEVITLAHNVVDRINKFDALPSEWTIQTFGDIEAIMNDVDNTEVLYEQLLEIQDKLNNVSETVKVPISGNLKPESVVAYSVSSNGIIFTHTVENDVQNMLSEFSDFLNIPVAERALDFIETKGKNIIFKSSVEDNQFTITYNSEYRTIEVVRNITLDIDEEIELFKQMSSNSFDPLNTLKDISRKFGFIFLKGGEETLKAIDTRSKLETNFGKLLNENINARQVNLILGDKWIKNTTYGSVESLSDQFYIDLINTFIGKYTEESNLISDMLKLVHTNLALLGVESEANIQETDENSIAAALDSLANSVKLKTKKENNPMDKLKQDLKDNDNVAKKQFEFKVRELFKGAETTDPIKTMVNNAELLYRRSIADKVISNANIGDVTLTSLGIDAEIASLDPKKVINDNMQLAQTNSVAYRALKDAFKKLDKYTTEKLKDC